MTKPVPPQRDDDQEDLSQRAHRLIIGVLGLALPLLLYVLTGIRPTAPLPRWDLLRSVSAYYYTGAVGVFVGVLFALSLFLLTYRGYKGVRADRVVGAVGGTAAIFVALFPTRPPGGLPAPPWWSETTKVVHYVAAATLFTAFILFAVWLFRKSSVPNRRDRPPDKRRRDDLCLACGVIMIGCVLWTAGAALAERPIFWPEAIAIAAFAVSWLVKGEAHQLVRDVISRTRPG